MGPYPNAALIPLKKPKRKKKKWHPNTPLEISWKRQAWGA